LGFLTIGQKQNQMKLGYTVDNHLKICYSFQHVSDVFRSCNYHIRSLHHIRPLIDHETAVNLACSIVASRLNYFNSVLYDASETNVAKLQRMRNNLARVVCKLPYNSEVAELLRKLHWLPVLLRITYEVVTIRVARETASNLVTYWTHSPRISLLEHYTLVKFGFTDCTAPCKQPVTTSGGVRVAAHAV